MGVLLGLSAQSYSLLLKVKDTFIVPRVCWAGGGWGWGGTNSEMLHQSTGHGSVAKLCLPSEDP